MATKPKNAFSVIELEVPHANSMHCIKTLAACTGQGGVEEEESRLAGYQPIAFGRSFCGAFTSIRELYLQKSAAQKILRGLAPSVPTNSNSYRRDGN
jgi:hypothetical protein